MIFQQIRSATIKIYYDNVCFLIDPWLMDPCSEEEKEEALKTKKFITKPIVPLPFSAEEILKDVDYCIVSHDHADHFSTDYLPKDMPMIFQNEKDMELGKRLGFTNVMYFKTDCMTFGDIQIKRTDGRHGDTDEMAEKAGPVSGFIFSKEGEKKVYVAGDTVYYDYFEKVILSERPDVIIVNACDARGRTGRLIMNTEDVIKTCICANDSIIIASHMDTVSHAHLTRKELKKNLENTPYIKQVLIPEDGESLTF
ncbi:MAG: MBL fold metallo-hydrolase [Solobacterium sp.]|nr:MBL fold metallo-hydrolase [Solobacterium sp.]